jgi:hypothetical protein
VAIALLVPAVVSLACGGGPRAAATTATAQETPKATPTPIRIEYDRQLDGAARVLAGLVPDDQNAFAAVTGSAGWQAYQAEFDKTWAQSEANRFAEMRRWRDQEVPDAASGCKTLFYPFAGPDILNAYLLFPKCDRYVLFGLEKIGALPALEALPAPRLERLLADVRKASADMFERNYFITSRMSSDLSKSDLQGTSSLILLFLARFNARIQSVERVDISADGTFVPPAPAKAVQVQKTGRATAAAETATVKGDVPAIRIKVVAPDGRVQEIIYFRAYVDDGPLKQHPAVMKYLDTLKPFKTFIKSASYLLHGSDFSTVRDFVLRNSTLIVQDDTGVPYRFLKPGEWDVRLYGKYAKPVKDFNYGFQKDLDAVFTQPGQAKPLPFSYGYHWKDGASAVVVAVKKPTA